MAKCVFCHQGSGHGPECAMLIPTEWSSGPRRRGSGPELDLARSLIAAWRSDSCVHDRGSSQDEANLEALWDGLDKALAEGDVETAMALLFQHYNPAEESAPTPERGVSGEGSQQGDTP